VKFQETSSCLAINRSPVSFRNSSQLNGLPLARDPCAVRRGHPNPLPGPPSITIINHGSPQRRRPWGGAEWGNKGSEDENRIKADRKRS